MADDRALYGVVDPQLDLLCDLRTVLREEIGHALGAARAADTSVGGPMWQHMDSAIAHLRQYQAAFRPTREVRPAAVEDLRRHWAPRDAALELSRSSDSPQGTHLEVPAAAHMWPLTVQAAVNETLRALVEWTTATDGSNLTGIMLAARGRANLGADCIAERRPSQRLTAPIERRWRALGGDFRTTRVTQGWRVTAHVPLPGGAAQ